MNTENAKQLIDKYIKGNCTPDEERRVKAWYNQLVDENEDLKTEPDYLYWEKNIYNRLPYAPKRSIPLWAILSAACLFASLFAGGLIIYTNNTADQALGQAQRPEQTIQPGGNKATLTLVSGQQIILNDAANGPLAEQSGVKITKTADGQVMYTIARSNTTERPGGLNTITTPQGGQYQVILPDGTKVWLNAASSLKYPASFCAPCERRVELSGEAYFEVAKKFEGNRATGKRLPFMVTTATQTIEVLGTHFNVNSYADEPVVKTTLLEGSIKVSGIINKVSRLLKPGQQSELSGNNTITISEANLAEAVAWKDGFFRFNGEDIKSIMRKLSRWYAIDVAYEGRVTPEVYYGKISRTKNISEVLQMLQKAQGVHFTMEGRRVIVKQ